MQIMSTDPQSQFLPESQAAPASSAASQDPAARVALAEIFNRDRLDPLEWARLELASKSNASLGAALAVIDSRLNEISSRLSAVEAHVTMLRFSEKPLGTPPPGIQYDPWSGTVKWDPYRWPPYTWCCTVTNINV